MNTKSQIRKAFKALGYKLSIRTNPLKETLVNLVVSGNGLGGLMISDATVISVETFQKHKAMFDLANSVRGQTIEGVKIS